MESINEIMATLISNNMIIVDDHNESEIKAQVVLLRTAPNGEIQVCLGFTKAQTPYYSVNPLYVGEDKKVHLSTWSVGGVVDNRQVSSEEEAIKKYNRVREENPAWNQDRLTILNISNIAA